jgi:hypothetical protein
MPEMGREEREKLLKIHNKHSISIMVMIVIRLHSPHKRSQSDTGTVNVGRELTSQPMLSYINVCMYLMH